MTKIKHLSAAKETYKAALKGYVTLSYCFCGLDDVAKALLALDAPKSVQNDSCGLDHLLVLVDEDSAEDFFRKHKYKPIATLDPWYFPIQDIIDLSDCYTFTKEFYVDDEVKELEVTYAHDSVSVELVQINKIPIGFFCANHEVNTYLIADEADCDYVFNHKGL